MRLEVNVDEGQKYYCVKRFGTNEEKPEKETRKYFPTITDINKFDDLILFNIKPSDFVKLEIF